MEISNSGNPSGIIKSLRTYNLVLATVTKTVGYFLVLDESDTRFTSLFGDVDSCAIFIQAKYSDGLKPHKHVWDLAINNMIQPAYTVRCMIPGCQGRLTVPHPWRKGNDSNGRDHKNLERDKSDRGRARLDIQIPSRKSKASSNSTEVFDKGDGGADGLVGRERHSNVRAEPQPTSSSISVEVWTQVMVDMIARDKMGTEKYGTPLKTFNGRNALVDAYQEALDLVVYLKQQILENELMRGAKREQT